MNLSRILNAEEPQHTKIVQGRGDLLLGGPSAPERLSFHPASASSFTSFHKQDSLPSLSPLESALPPLSRTTSDYSEAAASPITPDYTSDRSPTSRSFERDTKRHYPFGPQRPQLNPHQRRHPPPSRSHPYSATSPMDAFDMPLTGEYPDSLGLMSFPKPLLQDMSHMPMNSIPSQPLPILPQNVPLAPMNHQAVPGEARQAPVKPQRKNSYPCPVSKQYGCSEHFTTSGHAARHAKKHTGKKDAICPECQKAFTRKDNMEQHRRTHAGGRATSKLTSEDSRQRKAMKVQQQKKSTIKSPVKPQVEPDLPMLSMPSTIIDAQSLLISDPTQLTMLDPQLQSSSMQPSFAAEDMTNIAMSLQPQPMYSMNEMIPIVPLSDTSQDPALIRDGPMVAVQDQMPFLANIASPSTTSSSSKHDTPLSPSLSLDALADAAASRLQ